MTSLNIFIPYVVAAGQSLYYTDPDANQGSVILLNGQAVNPASVVGQWSLNPDATLTILGSVGMVFSSASSVVGIQEVNPASNSPSFVAVGPGGQFSLGSEGQAEGYWGEAPFTNNGSFYVSAAQSAEGVRLQDVSGRVNSLSGFDNTGSFTVRGDGATGVENVRDHFFNSGTLTVNGEGSASTAAIIAYGAKVANSGAITADTTGLSIASPFLIGSPLLTSSPLVLGVLPPMTITNTGVITAATAISFPSGVLPPIPTFVNGAVTTLTTGVFPILHLENSGTINGDIFAGDTFGGAGGYDGSVIHNTGAINGKITLDSGGDDVYDGRGGTLSGGIVFPHPAASGADTVYLGSDGERVQGVSPNGLGQLVGAANLIVYGGAGNDTVVGGLGVNYIDGGAGNDTLTGGGTHDVFVMDANVGHDEITDFKVASDVVDIGAFASRLTSLAQVLAASTQAVNGGVTTTTINLGGSSSVTLDGVSMASLTAANFAFSRASATAVAGSSANSFTATFEGSLRQYAVGAGAASVAGGPENANDFLVGMHRIQFVDGYLAVSPTDTAGQVYRLYEATLGRAPDQAGLTNWVNELNGGSSLQNVAAGFVGSQEFQNEFGNLNNSNFVTLLYNNVLHRPPDQAGLTNWVNLLGTGQETRAQVVVGFSESQENIADLAAPVQQGLWIGDPAAGEVARLYDTMFSRLPDSAGLANWTHALESGTNLLTVANGFVASTEFQTTYGALNNSDYVTLLYHNVLHRDPDGAGLANWVGLLNGGESRAQVAVGFSESPEHIGATAAHIDSGIWVAG